MAFDIWNELAFCGSFISVYNNDLCVTKFSISKHRQGKIYLKMYDIGEIIINFKLSKDLLPSFCMYLNSCLLLNSVAFVCFMLHLYFLGNKMGKIFLLLETFSSRCVRF